MKQNISTDEVHYKIPARVLLTALLLSFGIFTPSFVVPPLEDVISRQMNISHAQASLLFSLPVAVLALVAIPSGFLTDRIGLKRSLAIGALIATAGSALRGVTSSYLLVVFFTLLYGIGLGICFPNLPKLARHCSSRERANFTMSLLTAGILISGGIVLAIGRPMIYRLTGTFQGVSLISTVPILIGLIIWWIFISDPPCQSAEMNAVGVDWAALRKLMYRKDLLSISLLFWLHNFVLFTFIGWLPQFLADIGADRDLAGLITSFTFWVGIPSVILLSRLSANLGKRKPFLWGPSILLAVMMYAATLVNVTWSWLIVSLVGIATTIRFSTILSLPVEIVDPNQAGMTSGMVMSIGYTGALAGPLIGGIILDKSGSYEWIFLSMVIISVITIFVAFIVPETGGLRNK